MQTLPFTNNRVNLSTSPTKLFSRLHVESCQFSPKSRQFGNHLISGLSYILPTAYYAAEYIGWAGVSHQRIGLQ